MKTIRILAALCVALLGNLANSSVDAQSTAVVILPGGCGSASFPASDGYLTLDSTGKLCTAASVSASITGFPTVQTTGTPIAVTTGGVIGTLPAGAVVVASNAGGTNVAYCKLGASASTSDQPIPPNSWFGFTVGANTQLTCITSTSTTTVNMVGGSGLPTGSGGGGGGSGGGGAVTVAAGADVTEGNTTDAACAADNTSGCTVESRLIRIAQNLSTLNTTAGAAVPAGTNTIGTVGQLPYPVGAVPLTASNTGTTAATTATLAGAVGKTTYICSLSVRANATANTNATDTVTGVITGTLSRALWVPANTAGLGIDEMIYNPCVPASATNTGIAVVSGAPGTGGVVTVNATGYQL